MSAGKRKKTSTRGGNPHIRSLLVECAWAAIRVQGYLREKFYKLRTRRGTNRAIMAIAHKLAIAIFHVLTKKQPYSDLGADYFDKRRGDPANRLIRRLQKLGYSVTRPEPATDAPAQAPAGPTSPKKPAVRPYVLKTKAATSSAPKADRTPSNRANRRQGSKT